MPALVHSPSCFSGARSRSFSPIPHTHRAIDVYMLQMNTRQWHKAVLADGTCCLWVFPLTTSIDIFVSHLAFHHICTVHVYHCL